MKVFNCIQKCPEILNRPKITHQNLTLSKKYTNPKHYPKSTHMYSMSQSGIWYPKVLKLAEKFPSMLSLRALESNNKCSKSAIWTVRTFKDIPWHDKISSKIAWHKYGLQKYIQMPKMTRCIKKGSSTLQSRLFCGLTSFLCPTGAFVREWDMRWMRRWGWYEHSITTPAISPPPPPPRWDQIIRNGLII